MGGMYQPGLPVGGTAGQVPVKGTPNAWADLIVSDAYDSGQQTMTAGGLLTMAHGLGVAPKLCIFSMVCTTADGGYSINDEIILGTPVFLNAVNRGWMIYADATNIYCRFGTDAPNMLNKGTGVSSGFVYASWKFRVRAYA